MRDHTKLKAFQMADKLVLMIYQVTQSFPKSEIFGLIAQMRRAAISICSNIVEGCARQSQLDYLRFLDMAYGSCRELQYQLSLASRLGYIQSPSDVEQLAEETAKVLNALIRYFRK